MVSPHSSSVVLTVAAAATLVAALAHFTCIAIGPQAYRAMGAGDRVVLALARGDRRPHFAAFAVGSVLLVVTAYALSGAGVLPPFPLLRGVLAVSALALIARAFLFPMLRPHFPGNSPRFWAVSSLACLVLGSLYVVGSLPLWRGD